MHWKTGSQSPYSAKNTGCLNSKPFSFITLPLIRILQRYFQRIYISFYERAGKTHSYRSNNTQIDAWNVVDSICGTIDQNTEKFRYFPLWHHISHKEKCLNFLKNIFIIVKSYGWKCGLSLGWHTLYFQMNKRIDTLVFYTKITYFDELYHLYTVYEHTVYKL